MQTKSGKPQIGLDLLGSGQVFAMGLEMSTRLIIGLSLLVFLSLAAQPVAAEAPKDEIISYTATGEVIRRTLRPNGQVTDRLPYAED